jgi:hypothetical protein
MLLLATSCSRDITSIDCNHLPKKEILILKKGEEKPLMVIRAEVS